MFGFWDKITLFACQNVSELSMRHIACVCFSRHVSHLCEMSPAFRNDGEIIIIILIIKFPTETIISHENY